MNPPNDFVNVFSPNLKADMLKEMNATQTKYHQKKIPYDSYAAKNEFEQYCEQYEKEVAAAVSRGEKKTPEFNKEWDWDEYAKKDRWAAEGEWTEAWSPPNMKTGQTMPLLFYTKKYVGKKGGSDTITLTEAEYKALTEKKK